MCPREKKITVRLVSINTACFSAASTGRRSTTLLSRQSAGEDIVRPSKTLLFLACPPRGFPPVEREHGEIIRLFGLSNSNDPHEAVDKRNHRTSGTPFRSI